MTGTCQFPEGDPRFSFCGKAVARPGVPYVWPTWREPTAKRV
jgi:hypothetical protein